MPNKPIDVIDSELHLLFGQLADEFTERLRSGDSPDIEIYAERHPEHADAIRRALAGLASLGVPSRQEPVDPLDSPAPRERVLGDFQILREIGRGGMGVVYEAQQISLDRRVALKVLPFAALLDQHHVQRFKNEARAAAALDHPNIVPIHGVGNDRGVHFYAMKYVDGCSLAEWLARPPVERQDVVSRPQPHAPDNDTQIELQELIETLGSDAPGHDYRRIAQLGVQAAEALHHAHLRGIVHRDIKPSNLMLDSTGKLWVTDFGLASVHSNHDLTLTGDVLGTLRYMSPEQASGDRLIIDHRTDVYSLGITLYELLTGQPAFDEVHRERLLKSVLDSEPPNPRALDDQLPADLSVIVQTAIDKEPGARYASAEEMAADLRRFLDNRPIKARRPNLLQKLSKWTRRNRASTRALVFASLSAIICLSVVTINAGRALVREEQLRKRAEDATRQSEKDVDLARRAVDKFLTEAANPLIWQPDISPVAKDFYLQAVEMYEHLLDRPGTDSELLLSAAKAYAMAGFLHQFSDTPTESMENYEKADNILQRLLTQERRAVYALELSHVYTEGAIRLSKVNDFHAVFEVMMRSKKLLDELEFDELPNELQMDYFVCRAVWHDVMGTTYAAVDRLTEALPHHFAAEEIWKKALRRDQTEMQTRPWSLPTLLKFERANLAYWGLSLMRLNRYADAVERFQWIEKTTPLLRTHHNSRAYHRSRSHANQARLLLWAGELSEAQMLLQKGIATSESLRASLPHEGWVFGKLYRGYGLLCQVQAALNDLPAAEQSAMAMLNSVATRYESMVLDARYYHRIGSARALLGDVMYAQQRLDEAAEQFRMAHKALQTLKITLPSGKTVSSPDLVKFLALCPDERVADPQRAAEIARELTRDRNVTTWHRLQSLVELQAGNYVHAIAAANKACELRQGGDAVEWVVLALAHAQVGDIPLARSYYKKVPENASEQSPILFDYVNPVQFRRLLQQASRLLDHAENEASDATSSRTTSS